MPTMTIRNIDEALKRRLRMRAAAGNRSMEEEVRHILRAALDESPAPRVDLAARIRSRFTALGDVELPIVEREPVRPPPPLADAPSRGRSRRRTRSD